MKRAKLFVFCSLLSACELLPMPPPDGGSGQSQDLAADECRSYVKCMATYGTASCVGVMRNGGATERADALVRCLHDKHCNPRGICATPGKDCWNCIEQIIQQPANSPCLPQIAACL